MKKGYLLMPLIGGIIYLTTTSELPGSKLGNSISNCAQGGCHTGGTGSTTSINSFTITDQADNQVATTSYKPGHVYTVSFKGSNTANLPKFGYQLKASIGTFSSPGSGSLLVSSTMLSHGSTAIAATANVYTVTANWTAPAVGSGTLSFTGIFNAVNGNGSQTGDMPGSSQVFSFSEAATTAVNNLAFEKLKLYPVPASGLINLGFSANAEGSYTVRIYNTSGMCVKTQQVNVGQGSQAILLDISQLATGNYFLTLTSGGNEVLKAFSKQ